MAVAVANARQTVSAPVRKPRRYGLFSVVDIVDSGESHWILGGLTADGEECSRPEGTDILCGPTPTKDSRSWYSDLDADPWLAYMYETCKTVGRFDESAAKLRARFLASEQSAVETEFQDNVLDTATGLGAFGSVTQAVASLEAHAAAEYGGQIILHLGFLAAAEAFGHNGRGAGRGPPGDHRREPRVGRQLPRRPCRWVRHRPGGVRHRGDRALPQRAWSRPARCSVVPGPRTSTATTTTC